MPLPPPPNSNRVFVVPWVIDPVNLKTDDLRFEETPASDVSLVEDVVRVSVGLPNVLGITVPKLLWIFLDVSPPPE
jgi:hypothetical protein